MEIKRTLAVDWWAAAARKRKGGGGCCGCSVEILGFVWKNWAGVLFI